MSVQRWMKTLDNPEPSTAPMGAYKGELLQAIKGASTYRQCDHRQHSEEK